MSKLGCQCGHVISDTTDFIAYKARFLRDEDSEILDLINADICSFMEAYKEGKKAEWISNYFGKNADKNMRNDWVIMNIQSHYEVPHEGVMYQCEKCGRIKIETLLDNYYASFAPEGENWENVLKGKRRN